MVLQVAVRDIGQLTDLALQPDEPLIGRLIGARPVEHALLVAGGTTDRSEKGS
jgi:hypothetical protein